MNSPKPLPLRRPLDRRDLDAIRHAARLLDRAGDYVMERSAESGERCVLEAMRVLARLQAERER